MSTPNKTFRLGDDDVPTRPTKKGKPLQPFELRILNSKLDFISDSILAVSKNLDRGLFDELEEGTIDWVPPVQNPLNVPTPTGLGSNNVHYVVPRIDAVFGGRTQLTGKMKWDDIETLAEKTFQLKKSGTSKTRNIDYTRTFKQKGKTYNQYCEIKKTTGSYKNPPTFIRSSLVQLEALCSKKKKLTNQISPSIYICASMDFDQKTRKWLVTWWFIPCRRMIDFILFNTSDFKWNAFKTKQNNGYLI